MCSFNTKSNVPADIPSNKGYISSENLKTQKYLNDISEWTKKKKIKLKIDKTKIMLFNYTTNHQFPTRVTIDDVNIEVVEQAKLLGTHITNNFKWDINTAQIVKKSNSRVQLLQKRCFFWCTTRRHEAYLHFICQKLFRNLQFCMAQKSCT